MADNSKKPGQNPGKGKQGNPGAGANRLNQDENLNKKTSNRLSAEEDRDFDADLKRSSAQGHNKGGNKGNKR